MLTPGRLLLVAALLALLALAAFGPLIWDDRAEALDTVALQQGASWSHPFGTDELGRDLFARTLVATRTSLLLAAATAGLGFAFGVALGLLPLLAGPRLRSALATTINLLVAFPGLLLALLVATIVGIGSKGAVIALAVALAPQCARLTQTLAGSVGGSEFVAASRVVGVRWPRLLGRHVLPNIAPPLVLQLAASLSAALLALPALSFLGLGVQPPDYDWGRLLGDGLDRMYVTPMAALGPGIVIVLAGVIFNATGDMLAAALASERPDRGRRRRARRAAAAGPAVATADAGGRDEVAAGASADGGRAAAEPVLRVEQLQVALPDGDGEVVPVRGVSFAIAPGERVGIVGESGSGKSLTALAAAELLDAPAVVTAETVALDGEPVRELPRRRRDALLGRALALVPQDPLSALNPALRIGGQLTEAARAHRGLDREQARAVALERLEEMRIDRPQQRLRQHPHELSGGMRQRAVIAMGMTVEPRLLVADEPTTALDVAVEREVLRALRAANERDGTAVLLISHDVGVVGGFCERVLVMYAGRIVEELPAAEMRERAVHPYTRALLAAVPDMAIDRDRPLATIPGRPPHPREVGAGCAFAARCAHASARCAEARPPLRAHGDPAAGRRVACWHPQEGVTADTAAAPAEEERS